MRCALFALIFACFAPGARAEIHLHDSVEWLCQRSEQVARGTLTAVSPDEPSEQDGKSRDLVSLTLRPTEVLRGGSPSAGSTGQLAPIHFSMRVDDTVRLRQWMRDRTELVVFLRSTAQGYRRDGISYNLWPVRETGSAEQVLVELARPHVHLLAAGDMTVVTTPAQLSAACARVRGAPPPAADPPKPELLEVPHQSAVYSVLYSGSACYLYVPPGLFKGSQRGL